MKRRIARAALLLLLSGATLFAIIGADVSGMQWAYVTSLQSQTGDADSLVAGAVRWISSDDSIAFDFATYANGTSPDTIDVTAGSGTGQSNTASNLGAGVGVFEGKVSVDLQFRSIVGADGISVTEDVGNDEVDVAVDITGLASLGASAANDDSLMMWDTDANAHKSMAMSDIPAGAGSVEGLSYSLTLEDPAASTEDFSIAFTNRAITITEIRCVVRGTSPDQTWTVRHGATRSDTGAEAVTGGTNTTSTTGSSGTGYDVTSFNDATVVADSFLWFETTAQSGTVDEIHLTIVYTED